MRICLDCRVQVVHDSGHCVPQQARFMQGILRFVVSFAPIPLVAVKPVGYKQHGRAQAAATAGGRVAGVEAELAAKLHAQGLHEKVVKGRWR